MMKIRLFETQNTTIKQQHYRHITTLCLTIMLGWLLWYISSIPDYMGLSPAERHKEFLSDLWQTALETTLLFELAIQYSKPIISVLWNKPHTFPRLVQICIILLCLNFVCSGLIGWLYTLLYPDIIDSGIQYKIMFSDGITVYFVTSICFMSYLFYRHYEESEKVLKAENEITRKNVITQQAKLDKLALQTNNHFIFNSFSVLDSLIAINSHDARPFLHRLTNIYRYLVSNADKHITPIKAEIAFTKEYIDIILLRYSGIYFAIEDGIDRTEGMIPPVSIQQLVENAVKHNRHGKDDTLNIKIFCKDNYIYVSNNILPRSDTFASTGHGLKNLESRYQLISQKEMLFVNDGMSFCIGLPILFIEDIKNESLDY